MLVGLQTRRGFVVVDVMTALAMLAATLSFTLMAMTTALKLERAASESRDAERLLRDLADRPYGRLGETRGAEGDLAWRVRLDRLASGSTALASCSLSVTVDAKGRGYALASVTACPEEIR